MQILQSFPLNPTEGQHMICHQASPSNSLTKSLLFCQYSQHIYSTVWLEVFHLWLGVLSQVCHTIKSIHLAERTCKVEPVFPSRTSRAWCLQGS
nr:hypothetical protein Iba_chr12aCG2770 [Ipomoea batatas]GMD69877.1 hypothetical protein Iba_chr12eCG0870 [Ipomoea batatas]GMD71866.1 hypothetical protein Iba_chr12fCG3020 [Ipomoea batatas]